MLANRLLKQDVIPQETTQEKIEGFIRKSRHYIWTKNIWFTNWEIQQLLIEKAQRKMSVELILPADFIKNNKRWINFQEFADAGIEIFIETTFRKGNINDFILIDNNLILDPFSDVYTELDRLYSGKISRPDIKKAQIEYLQYKNRHTKNTFVF